MAWIAGRPTLCRDLPTVVSVTMEWDDNYRETETCEFAFWWREPRCASGERWVPTCEASTRPMCNE